MTRISTVINDLPANLTDILSMTAEDEARNGKTMTARQIVGRPLAAIVTASAFGVAVAVLKGGDAGIRDAIGNISAPWLLLPYLAASASRGPIRGALLGGATCLAALMGFYVAEAFVLDLGGHPLVTNLILTLRAGRQYFAAGVLFGPLFGALGSMATPQRRPMTAAVVGIVLAGEPLAVFAWLSRQGISPADTGLVVEFPALWLGEMILGLLLAAALTARSARSSSRRTAAR